jgi:hypothetical protein
LPLIFDQELPLESFFAPGNAPNLDPAFSADLDPAFTPDLDPEQSFGSVFTKSGSSLLLNTVPYGSDEDPETDQDLLLQIL